MQRHKRCRVQFPGPGDPWGGYGNSLQSPVLLPENRHGQRSLYPVHEVAKSRTRLKRLNVHTLCYLSQWLPVYVPVRRVCTLFLPEVHDIFFPYLSNEFLYCEDLDQMLFLKPLFYLPQEELIESLSVFIVLYWGFI